MELADFLALDGGLVASFGPRAILRALRQAFEQEPMPGRDVATSLRLAKHGYRLCWAAGALGSILGAILLTGYLGGATATHVRVGDPFVMPVVVGVVVWLALFLREPRLRALVPLRAKTTHEG